MSFLDELKCAKERGDSEREADYKPFLQAVKANCKAEAFKGRNWWKETATPARTGAGDTLLPAGPDLREKYLYRLKEDLYGLDVKTSGEYLHISWPEVK